MMGIKITEARKVRWQYTDDHTIIIWSRPEAIITIDCRERMDNPFSLAKKIAEAMGMQLEY